MCRVNKALLIQRNDTKLDFGNRHVKANRDFQQHALRFYEVVSVVGVFDSFGTRIGSWYCIHRGLYFGHIVDRW